MKQQARGARVRYYVTVVERHEYEVEADNADQVKKLFDDRALETDAALLERHDVLVHVEHDDPATGEVAVDFHVDPVIP